MYRKLPPIELPIDYTLSSASSLSPWNLEHSIETPTPQTLSDDMDWHDLVPSPDLPPLSFAEIDAECQREPCQELIDRLDTARYSGS